MREKEERGKQGAGKLQAVTLHHSATLQQEVSLKAIREEKNKSPAQKKTRLCGENLNHSDQQPCGLLRHSPYSKRQHGFFLLHLDLLMAGAG